MSVSEILRKPETLRKMLDERGAEHYDRFDVTEWVSSDGEICHTSVIHSNGVTVLVLRKCVTTEQAIAATLGQETCHITDNGPWGYPYVCSACGASFDPDVNNGEFNYCPNCGRKVVNA